MLAFPRSEQIRCSRGPLSTNVRLEHYDDSVNIHEQSESIIFCPSSGEWHSYQVALSELANNREFKKLRRLL